MAIRADLKPSRSQVPSSAGRETVQYDRAANAWGRAPRRNSVHAFQREGSGAGELLITCTPDQVVAEFAKHGITFVGPPLAG